MVTHSHGTIRGLKILVSGALRRRYERLAHFGHQVGNDQRGSQEGNQCQEVNRLAQRYIYIETRLSKEVVQT